MSRPIVAPSCEQPQHRDQRHLERDDQEPDDDDEQHVPPPELHPREGVGGERRDRDGDHRGRDRDREAVQERVPEPARVQREPVVLERPLRRLGTGARAPSTTRWCPRASSGRNDVISTPSVGISQSSDDDQDRDPDEPAALAAPSASSAPPGSRAAGRLGDRDRGSAHRIISCSRNRRMFQIITGMIATNRTTAIAAPRPSLLRDEEPVDHAFGDHLGARSVSALPMTKTMSKTFSALMTM